MVAAPAPFEVAARLADRIEDDPTPEVIIDALPVDATVTLLGWPDLAGEAVLRRGDATVLAVDIADEGASFVRRLQRNDVEAEIVEAAGIAAAVLASDVVLIEALACTATQALAVQGSLAAAAVAYTAEVPAWLVAGRGRCLPDQVFDVVRDRAEATAAVAWRAEAEPLPIGLVSHVARDDAVVERDAARLVPECPVAYELLRVSPMYAQPSRADRRGDHVTALVSAGAARRIEPCLADG